MRPEYVIIHHSLTKDGSVVDAKAIIAYHESRPETYGRSRSGRGGGYHGYIETAGGRLTYTPGRDVDEEGAHCREARMNHRSLGICVVGNFDIAPASLEVLGFLRDWCFAAMVNFGIPSHKIIGHRDAGLMDGYDWRKTGPTDIPEFKSCPGRYFPFSALLSMVMGKM